ncbi:hypothetical protein O181_096410, partial [Austropuccinia psidii MF-1]|nr:hypothetical protein [Austropuccinia psidii MF-1]
MVPAILMETLEGLPVIGFLLPKAHSPPGKMSHQSLAIDFTSSRIKIKLTQSKNQANIEHMSHSGITPNLVTSTNIGSPVPSTEISHHLIVPQPSK